MNHTKLLTPHERVLRITNRLRMLAYMTDGERDALPPMPVWRGLSEQLDDIAVEVEELQVASDGERATHKG